MALERRWFTAGTNEELWKTRGTYSAIDWEKLPPIDAARHDGSFDWLAEEPDTYGIQFGQDEDDLPEEEEIAKRVKRIVKAATKEHLTVPKSFVRFFEDGERTYRRIPTCTACYLDLSDRVTEIPGEPGRMLRFMNDQQCCLVWGLHLLPDGSHRVLVATPSFKDAGEGSELEDAADFVKHAICADDFEEFIHRFWLENVLWKRTGERTPEMAAYVAHAVANR